MNETSGLTKWQDVTLLEAPTLTFVLHIVKSP
jgi:hypothetical protein